MKHLFIMFPPQKLDIWRVFTVTKYSDVAVIK